MLNVTSSEENINIKDIPFSVIGIAKTELIGYSEC